MLNVFPSDAQAQSRKNATDLLYGEALYHFYQQDYFNAITLLERARAESKPRSGNDASELLLGGMYLSYGLTREARPILETLVKNSVDESKQQRVWHTLGRLLYREGRLHAAANALDQINTSELTGEQLSLFSEILITLRKYNQVIGLLEDSDTNHTWTPYMKYNQAIALLLNEQEKEGLSLLNELGEIESDNEELLAVKDKANITLGYHHLKQDNLDLATTFLERVRLNSPFTNRALSGIAKARMSTGQPDASLILWQTLSSKNQRDPQVQEAKFILPFAIEMTGQLDLAAQYFQSGIEAYQTEINELKSVKTGILKEGLLRDYLEGLAPAIRTDNERFAELFEQTALIQATERLKELVALRDMLDRSKQSIVAFNDMLTHRRTAYTQRLPLINQRLDQINLDEAQQNRDEFAKRLNLIESRHDTRALADSDERDLLNRIDNAENFISRHHLDQAKTDHQKKLHIYRGLLVWQLEQRYADRLWSTKKHLKQLDQQIIEAKQRRDSIGTAQLLAPLGFEGFDERIISLNDDIERLSSDATRLLRIQYRFIQHSVLAKLDKEQSILEDYLSQSQFHFARVLDQLISNNAGKMQ
ncbi:MAG: tetratricopeptide repeat protein [Gammaproteobacteria bacterium]